MGGKEAISARGFPVFFFKLKFPNYCLSSGVMSYKHLGKISDNLHPNNQNNWLERRAQPPRDVP